MVSHAEPIRAAVLHYCGLPLDDFARIAVEPASITTVLLRGRNGRIGRANERLEDFSPNEDRRLRAHH